MINQELRKQEVVENDELLEPTGEDLNEIEEEEYDLKEEILDDLEGIDITDSVKIHLKEIGRKPLLSPEEEIELAKRMEKGDNEAKKKFTEANLRLVVSIAKRYRGRGMLSGGYGTLLVEPLLTKPELLEFQSIW